jgi:hypothetical protein
VRPLAAAGIWLECALALHRILRRPTLRLSGTCNRSEGVLRVSIA